MRKLFFVEVTDTYGGEANFSWVKRFKVTARTERGAMRIVGALMGYGSTTKDYDTGDMQRWVWKNAGICAFVEHYDNKTV